MQIALYLHTPFCQAKCAYCDFASVAGRGDLFERYGQAVIAELTQTADPACHFFSSDWNVETVYVGGGTPSVLPLSIMRDILSTIVSVYAPGPGAEITVEVNPGTVDHAYLAALREAGVNRLSVGVQSFDNAELRLLGRIHDRRRALETLADARAAGFERLNLDLIFGLPGQTLAGWERSVSEALACRPAHMSMYALSLEEGTPLAGRVARGELPAPDGDLAAEMYELAGARLAAAGYEQYEISNWALPGDESRHNLHTWRNGPYLGFGPAAHSHLGRRRWWNVADPDEYVARLEAGQSPLAGSEDLDEATDMAETMILGLRLVRDGVDIESFRRRYGRTPAELYGPILDELLAWGLVEITPARVRLTPRGRLLGNQVFARFLPD
jgi:oxygen-independent coproporphyrinogen III oxidase